MEYLAITELVKLEFFSMFASNLYIIESWTHCSVASWCESNYLAFSSLVNFHGNTFLRNSNMIRKSYRFVTRYSMVLEFNCGITQILHCKIKWLLLYKCIYIYVEAYCSFYILFKLNNYWSIWISSTKY